MAVVKDYYDGNTHVIIRDDSFVSPEEQQRILKRCGAIAARQYYTKAKEDKAENEAEDKTA